MGRYTADTFHEITVEWDFDVDPGYRGSLTEPPERPSVQNVRAWMTGPKGQRHPMPDWWIDLEVDDDSLLIEAQEQREQALCDAADARREVA